MKNLPIAETIVLRACPLFGCAQNRDALRDPGYVYGLHKELSSSLFRRCSRTTISTYGYGAMFYHLSPNAGGRLVY